mmetsp:Transcript_315/g.955  ORF Transcript_315/g.955 Transcript_315/m.955 type:complete len:215 (+) Transcript_315:833-1477(+)
MGYSLTTCWMSFMQPSKSVSMEMTMEPLEMGWTSWERVILSCGRKTMEGMPAEAQYAARAAEVSPVEAQPTARMSAPLLIMLLTCDTSTVMPKSLKLPVCVFPHCLIHKSSNPISFPNRSAQNTLEFPSNMLTTSSSGSPGSTHSFLLHTPLPYGHTVLPDLLSKRSFHSSGPTLPSASISCCTSNNPPDGLRYTTWSSGKTSPSSPFAGLNGT